MAGTNTSNNGKKSAPSDPFRVSGIPLTDIQTLIADLRLPIPTGADPDYRKSLADILLSARDRAAQTPLELEKLIKKDLGAVNQIPKPPNQEDRALKTRAISVVQSALAACKVPKKLHAQAPEIAFNDEILKMSKKPAAEFMNWIRNELDPSRLRRWNSANVVTAAYTLNTKHPSWERMGAAAAATAKALTEKLTSLAKNESFSTISMSNICSTLPPLLKAITLSGPNNEGLDEQLINSLTKIVKSSHEAPSIEYFHSMLFAPLGECQSVYLSPAGQRSLCEYAFELTRLTSTVKFADALEVVGDSFRAMKGICSWTNGPEEEDHLVKTLKGLNDRLAACTEKFNNQSVVAITSAFQGIDFQKVGPATQSEIARSFELIRQGISGMEGNLNARALGMLLYNFSNALDITAGPMHAPFRSLLAQAYDRRPQVQYPEERLTTLSDVAFLCTGLLALAPCAKQYSGFVKSIWDTIRKTDYRKLAFTSGTDEGVTSWATINKTFALYRQQIPEHLAAKLERLAPSAHASAYKSKSKAEGRALEAIQSIPGVSIINTSFIDGWDVDLLVKLPNERYLIVEVDGKHHQEPIKRRTDHKIRDPYFKDMGHRTVRISSLATTEQFQELLEPFIKAATPATTGTKGSPPPEVLSAHDEATREPVGTPRPLSGRPPES